MVISRADDSNNRDIWTLDLSRNVSTRVTFDPSTENIPVWSPDGSQVGFDSDRSGIRELYRIGSGGAGQAEQLTSSSNPKRVVDWSPDGRFLLYIETDPSNAGDILALPLEPPRTPLVVVRTPFAETSASFSPDGKWVAYSSGSTGRQEVYVRSFPPDATDPWQVSNQGGTRTRWRRDGRELYFLGSSSNQQQPVMAVTVQVRAPRFESDAPVELFRVPTLSNTLASPYDLTADGQRFLFHESVNSTAPMPVTVITDWRATLRR